jgi:Domain of unknown function (DUF5916)/Carbohydrate family 9 binding domain-like
MDAHLPTKYHKMKVIYTLLLSCFGLCLYAQSSTKDPKVIQEPYVKRIINTSAAKNGDISLDGKLDEAAWQNVQWNTDFKVWEPDNGATPEFRTQFKILHDDKYLYIGYKAFDPAPDSIVKRMDRRDNFPGDWLEINIDSYHDLRTAFSFTLSASGVRGDEYITNNGENWDSNWNPIWDGASQIDSDGWSAEVKIPFSQLRYGNQTEPIWGVQVQRLIFRKGERHTFANFKQDGSGWVSRFAELHGLRNLPNNRGVELAPYVLTKAERFEKEEGNPFADGSRNAATVGLDGKFAVTRDLILDFTINPDFGQVEADPGAVRLDGFQNFFGERRPFFLESRNLFEIDLGGGGDDGSGNLLFYSRRIGGQPHSSASLRSGEYSDEPTATSILAATKFSGKTKKGLSIGLMESVAQREYAEIDRNGERRKELVEPRTNYFVGRVSKDYKEGNTVIGGVFTAVNREKGLDFLHKSAYSGGLDFRHSWKNRWWNLQGNLYASRVEGKKEAIAETQSSFGHYFQRPNAKHLTQDNYRTSLTGTAGSLTLAKWGGEQDSLGGIWKYSANVNWRSPELEINDIGFMQTADEISNLLWVGYHIVKPGKYYRTARFNLSQVSAFDFGGQYIQQDWNLNTNIQTTKQWNLGIGANYNARDISNNALRGGSSLRRPVGISSWQFINTDERKKVRFSANTWFFEGFEKTVKGRSIGVGIDVQPINALSISLSPGYDYGYRKQDQYVQNTSFGAQDRTIVSQVRERGFSLTARATYNLSPSMTIQIYSQPFIYRAQYQNYGYVIDPLNKEYDARFHTYTNTEIAYNAPDEEFAIDENRDGDTDYWFSKPDFNYIQMRSNLVMRWEYIPGSEFFLVWSQGSVPDAYTDLDSPLLSSLTTNVFSKKPQNIFLAKLTYRFLR